MDAPFPFALRFELHPHTLTQLAESGQWLCEQLLDLADEPFPCSAELAGLLNVKEPFSLTSTELLLLSDLAERYVQRVAGEGADAIPATAGELLVAGALLAGVCNDVQDMWDQDEEIVNLESLREDVACLRTLWLSASHDRPGDPRTWPRPLHRS